MSRKLRKARLKKIRDKHAQLENSSSTRSPGNDKGRMMRLNLEFFKGGQACSQ